MAIKLKKYSLGEEIFSGVAHCVGALLAIAATVLLIVFSALHHNTMGVVGSSIYGGTMIVLYTMSTLYHALTNEKAKKVFRVFDHCSIFLLIAGTYTPFLLVNLRGFIGWTVFGILWGIVLFGAYMKIKNPKQQPKWMVALYVAMGWTLLFILPAMIRNIPERGLWFILAGGLSYTIGVIFYLWRRMKFAISKPVATA